MCDPDKVKFVLGRRFSDRPSAKRFSIIFLAVVGDVFQALRNPFGRTVESQPAVLVLMRSNLATEKQRLACLRPNLSDPEWPWFPGKVDRVPQELLTWSIFTSLLKTSAFLACESLGLSLFDPRFSVIASSCRSKWMKSSKR
jgi:hypothetical protein